MLGLGGLWENAGWREARRGRNTDTLLLSRQQQSQFSACSSCPKRHTNAGDPGERKYTDSASASHSTNPKGATLRVREGAPACRNGYSNTP